MACHLGPVTVKNDWSRILSSDYILALTYYRHVSVNFFGSGQQPPRRSENIFNPWETTDTATCLISDTLKSFWYLKKKTDKEYFSWNNKWCAGNVYSCLIMKQKKPLILDPNYKK